MFDRGKYYNKNPNLVFVDSEIISQEPPRFLIFGIADALATWIKVKFVIRNGGTNHARGCSNNCCSSGS